MDRAISALQAGGSPRYPWGVRVFAIFALGMLVGLVAGYLAGKSSAGNSSRHRPENKNPWS